MLGVAGPEERGRGGEVELVNGTAAMSASGRYGKTRVCEAIIGWVDLMLGAKVRKVLEAEIEAGGGRFRGVRYGTSYDEGVAGKFVSRTKPPHRLARPQVRQSFPGLGQPRPPLHFL